MAEEEAVALVMAVRGLREKAGMTWDDHFGITWVPNGQFRFRVAVYSSKKGFDEFTLPDDMRDPERAFAMILLALS